MMSPENIPPPPENNSANRKTTSHHQQKPPLPPPQEQSLKCPRCDSSNTKFCYYNNYSLTQPRHFCKTCRRYWTRGGALRNVPIGGGCRKTKKLRTSSSSSATPTSTASKLLSAVSGGEFGGVPGFKFLTPNLNPGSTSAMEFQLGGLSSRKLHPATEGVYTQFITSSGPTPSVCGPGTGAAYFGLDLLAGLNYPPSSASPLVQVSASGTEANGDQQHISIASIESLSSINQEMHWKLQQQRLAMIYGPSTQDEDNKVVDHQEKSHGEINLFKNLEINSNENNAGTKLNVGPTEWLFDQINNSSSPNYAGNNNNNNNNNNNSSMVVNANSSCNNEVSGSNLHGVWGDLHHRQQQQHHQQLHQFDGLH